RAGVPRNAGAFVRFGDALLMQLTCPHCRHSVDYSAERPRFCSHCGHALAGSSAAPDETQANPPVPVDQTQAYEPEAAGSPSVNGVPDRIAGYKLGKRLGGGGMGSVYEAAHLASGQRVAVKL